MRNVACVIEVGACVTLSYATQGVACPLLNEGADASEASIKGRAFCFLPLPAETGLPVHVNGYFELSSNRRDIWRGDDMAGEGRTRAEWNQALLEDVVAPTYARMLLRLAKTTGPETLDWYYSIWPADTVAEPWLSLSRRVYVETLKMPVLYCNLGGGRWVGEAAAGRPLGHGCLGYLGESDR